MSNDSVSEAAPAPRYFALDSLRATAMLLGVFFHALLFGGMFGGGPPGGPPGMGSLSPSAAVQDWLHSFRMPLFFLISGFFCAMMLGKYQFWGYLYRRWSRIGVALLLSLFTFVPLYQIASQSFRGGGGPMARGGDPGGGGPGDGGPGGGFQKGGPRMGPGGNFDPPQPPPGFVPPPLARFDANQDGTIDDAEWEIARREILAGRVDPPSGGGGQFKGQGKGLGGQGKGFNKGGPGAGQGKKGLGKDGFNRKGRGNEEGERTQKGQGDLGPGGANAPPRDGPADGETKQGLHGGPDGGRQGRGGPGGGPGRGGPPGGPGGGMFGPPGEVSSQLFGSNVQFFTLSHLWFLWYLLVFATAAPLVALVMGAIVRLIKPLKTLGEQSIRWQITPLILGLAAIPLLMQAGGFFGWSLGLASGIGKGFPDFLWTYEPDFPFYFVYFLAGWWLFAGRSQLNAVANAGLINLGLGIAAHCAASWMSRTYSRQSDLENYELLRLGGLSLYSLGGAWTAWGFVGIFQKYFNRPTAVGKYLADTAFWVYLLHQALLMPVLFWLGPFQLPWYANGPLATALTMIAALLLFEAMVRPTPLMSLFGPGASSRTRTTAMKPEAPIAEANLPLLAPS